MCAFVGSAQPNREDKREYKTMPFSTNRTLMKPNSNIHYKGLNSFTLYSLMGRYAERNEFLMYTYLKNILIDREYLQ